jgi:putative transposase
VVCEFVAGRWDSSLNPLPVDEIKNAVGIDVGLEKFLATSDGQAVEIPQFYRKVSTALARHQRQLARMERGSKEPPTTSQ